MRVGVVIGQPFFMVGESRSPSGNMAATVVAGRSRSRSRVSCVENRNILSSSSRTRSVDTEPSSDAASVVDPLLSVRGVSHLRVVDASVMPTIIRGHTNAPAIVIGEHAADLIRGR